MPRPTLFEHRKFHRLCNLLQLDEPTVLGHLEFMWRSGYSSGDPHLGDEIAVEGCAKWKGARGALTCALFECGFIDKLDDGTYQIHDLHDNAPEYVKDRWRKEQSRKGKRRPTLSRKCPGHSRTRPGHSGKKSEMSGTPAPAPAPAPLEDNNPHIPLLGKFVKPTIEEVRAYCQERGNTVDPATWLAYYESNGWRVGKSAMKDWKASVRYWETNSACQKRSSTKLTPAEFAAIACRPLTPEEGGPR